MPKMKTNRGAAKRFKRTGTGKLLQRHAFHSHLLTGKNARRRRRLREPQVMSPRDQQRVRKLLPYA